MRTMKKYKGWWCPWCSTWVDGKKDVAHCDDQLIHTVCGNVVEIGKSDVPIIPTPPTKEVLKAQAEYQKMLSDWMSI